MDTDNTADNEIIHEEKRIRKTLPVAITSYDLLKTLALLLMLIDHTGYYFFPFDPANPNPDVVWLRVFGRLCVPMWFFLIGYARTTEISLRLMVFAGLAMLSEMAVGEFILPLNILFTIAAARYVRDSCALKTLESPEHMRGMFMLILFGTLPTALFTEYGSLVLLFVIFGFLQRNPEAVKVEARYVRLFIFFSFFFYIFVEGATIAVLTPIQALVFVLGLVGVFVLLKRFEPAEFPRLTAGLGPMAAVLKLTGRRTLELYVLHLIVFRGAVLLFYPETHKFWGWAVMDPELLSMIVRQG